MYKQFYKWQAWGIMVALFITFFPPSHMPTVQAANADLTVGSADTNLREGPGLSYPVITTVKSGTPLTTIAVEGDWIKVQTDQYEGWLANWLVKPADDTSKASPKIVVSQADRLNVRLEPNFSATIMAQMYTGDQATALKEQDGWIQIKWNEQIGWVSKDYVALKDANKSAQKVSTNDVFTVQVEALRIRSEASLNGAELGTAQFGEQFAVIQRHDNWVEIAYGEGSAYLYSFYGSFSDQQTSQETAYQKVTVIYNNTNVRTEASTNSTILTSVDAGEQYPIVGAAGDWYEIQMTDGSNGYIANWIVSTEQQPQTTRTANEPIKSHSSGQKGVLSGKTIVIDAGHGGEDRGTTGYRGTDEKDVTLKTATLLSQKLQAAGATVVMTRESDEYVTLRKRVSIAHQTSADAFISLHYDANENSAITGSTTYYFNDNQYNLAKTIHDNLTPKTNLVDRGVQPGNYYVVRENRQEAVLIELGFLTNPAEEQYITSAQFREQATLGIYNGILQYFK